MNLLLVPVGLEDYCSSLLYGHQLELVLRSEMFRHNYLIDNSVIK